jgi:hypothetical protein
MTNKINGDFGADSIEAFRAAYASRLLSPEDQEMDERTGLPTDVVLNTSPWIQHTGLWKANDGTNKNFVPNQTLVPGAEVELSDEELDSIIDEALSDSGDDEFEEEGMSDDDLEALLEELEEDALGEELDQEIDALLEEVEEDALGEELDQEIDALLEEVARGSLSDGDDGDDVDSLVGDWGTPPDDVALEDEEVETLLNEILDDLDTPPEEG